MRCLELNLYHIHEFWKLAPVLHWNQSGIMKKRRLYYHGDYAANGQIYNAIWDIFMYEDDFLRFDKFRPKKKFSSENSGYLSQLQSESRKQNSEDIEYYRSEDAPNIFIGQSKKQAVF